jgi:hypothetical protein
VTADQDPTTGALAEIRSLAQEFFRAVSFPHGGRPSYEKLHDIVIDDGKLIRNTSQTPEISTVDQFIAPRRELVDSGVLTSFEEVESAEVTEVFGNVAHRFSAYEKRGERDGEAFEGKGMISTQFIRTPDGWRISSMAWDDERPGLVIPDRYT